MHSNHAEQTTKVSKHGFELAWTIWRYVIVIVFVTIHFSEHIMSIDSTSNKLNN